MILYLITRILIHSWIHVILKLDKLENWSFLAHLIDLNCHLHHFLIPDIRCNFRNLINKITKRFKSLDFSPKMRHLPLFGYIKQTPSKFTQKMNSVTFMRFLKSNVMQISRKSKWTNPEKTVLQVDSIYLLKVNNRNTRTRCEICSKLIINIMLTLGILHTLF